MSQEIESKIKSIIFKNLKNILKNNLAQNIDLEIEETLNLNTENIQIKLEGEFLISKLEFLTSKNQNGYYELITDLKGKFKDEFFVIQ